MKACVLDHPANAERAPLQFHEVETPQPDKGEILVRVTACGVCRTDLHVVEGELPRAHLPIIPGHQVVGVVAAVGPGVAQPVIGNRVGVAWLHRTCGRCRFCASARENLCEQAAFTGWTVNGGFAEYIVAPAEFVYPLPQDFADFQAAPLLCAGIIGFRALLLTGLDKRDGKWSGARVGLYGFGAAGHVAIQLAKARGASVYVCTRDRSRHQKLATELGADWVGDTFDCPPQLLDAAIVFAPAGEIVPAALAALDKGGTLVLGGIHMSNIPAFEYRLLYHERMIRSVANNTRADGRAFLEEAARVGVRTHVEVFRLGQANRALAALKHDAIRGAAVLACSEAS